MILILTCTVCYSQGIFQKTFGTADYEEIWGLDLTFDGGYILGGYTGFGNAYIMRLNPVGDTVWTRKIVTGSFNLVYSIEQTSDSGFIAAGRQSDFGAGGLDMLLIKLDGNGNHQWTKAIGGANNETVNSIQQTIDGGFILAGNTFSFSAGSNDFYIVKTDASGNIIWSKSLGGGGTDNAYSIIQTSDGGYVAAGLSSSTGAGGQDILVVKLNNNGTVSWMKTYGGSGDDRANSVQQTADGGLIVSGVTNSFGAGGYDFNLIKTDSLGNVVWAKTFGTSGNDWSYCAQQTADSGYILTGYGTFGANTDYFLVKTNSTGDTLWTKMFGGGSDEYATVVKQTPDNGYAIAGYSQSFGVGFYDFYLVKTDVSGNSFCNQNHVNSIVTSYTPVTRAASLGTLSGGVTSTTSPSTSAGTTVNTLCSILPCDSLLLTFTVSVAKSPLSNGAMRVVVFGGEPPYLYSLDSLSFQMNNTFTALPLGTYQVYIIDSNGCTGEGTFIIEEANCNCRNH